MIRMPGSSHRGPLPPLTPEEAELAQALRRDVAHLAGEIGERNVFRAGALHRAAEWVEGRLEAEGFEVKGQESTVRGVLCRNLEAQLEGNGRREEIVLLGAHYDSVHGSPGADDNATGVAALLAIARRLRASPPARTVRFVAFVNEEPPFFQTDSMGSLLYARACRERGDRIVEMLSLESIGFYRDEPGSQVYPPGFALLYPNRGDFLAFVGNLGSRARVRHAIRLFREATPFPSEGATTFGWIPGIGWSDQWSFWKAGYPGVMVTDTAPFRNPGYHTQDDTPERIDYERLARVVAGLAKVASRLAAGG